VAKVSKPDDVAVPATEEVSDQPATTKARQIELPHSSSVRQLADLLQISAIEIIKLSSKG